jgi:hypothetical protein
MIRVGWQRHRQKVTKNAWTYLCNLASTDYELPEDGTIVSKHVAAV